MSVFHWSDPHIGHTNIIGFCNRPYGSVGLMNARLVANVNILVRADDLLIVHGDICFGDKRQNLGYLDQIRCQNKVLLPGNHDACWPGGKKNWKSWLGDYEAHFSEVRLEEYPGSGYPHMMEDGTEVVLSHFPYQGDSRKGDRYSAWRPFDDGLPLLHGHSHGKWIMTHTSKGTPMIDVGVDSWNYCPVSEREIASLLGV